MCVPQTIKMKTAIYASRMHCSSTDEKPLHASDTILERCVAGKTQHYNEILHSCIWRKCPEEVFVSKRRLEIAVTDAIEKHNLGYVKSLGSKEDSCLNDSFSLTIVCAERQDKRRVSQNISKKQKKRKRNVPPIQM
ncbi:uncharacterized protein TNCV_1095491 [Trichonephila clavipes]|nr:uncharacterized protein TNCV_1095491 [Trichonephila clavipes]